MHKRTSVAIAAFVAVLLIGCASASTYPAATHNYNIAGAAYKVAFDKIQNLRSIGKVNDAQWAQFVTGAAMERAADNLVAADLNAWKVTGKEPPTYAADWQSLQDAQAAVIALSNGVSL